MAMAFDAFSFVIDNAAPATSQTTLEHTPVGNPTFVVAGTHSDSGIGVPNRASSVTYGGNSMTLAVEQVEGLPQLYVALWYLASPLDGVQDLVVNWDGNPASRAKAVGVQTFTGGGVLALTSSDEGSSATASTTVGSVTDAIVVDALSYEFASATVPVAGAGQTQRYNVGGTTPPVPNSSTEAGASSVTMSWALASASFAWVICAISIPEAAAGIIDFSTPLPGEDEGPTGFGGKAPSFNPFPLSSLEFADYAFFKTTLDLQNKLKRIRIV